MTTRTIKSMLRMAVFTGAIGLVPPLALAESSSEPTEPVTLQTVPDHQQAEAKGNEVGSMTLPDHGTAEDRGTRPPDAVGLEAIKGVPDHNQAESRNAQPELQTK